MGESPTRPGIFQARPAVVVTPDISPLAFNARQLMVPVVGCAAIFNAQARVDWSASGNNACRRAWDFCGGASKPSVQLLWPPASCKDRFHTIHANRDFSVSR